MPALVCLENVDPLQSNAGIHINCVDVLSANPGFSVLERPNQLGYFYINAMLVRYTHSFLLHLIN